MSSSIDFIRGFLRDPRGVGSVWPSSKSLAHRVISGGRARSARMVVELGPGTGAITRPLLASIPAEGRLLALEIDPVFVRLLSRDVTDQRFTIQQRASNQMKEALTSMGEDRADLVVSGIPFSTMPRQIALDTIECIRQCLAPGGRFVAYQVRPDVRKLAEPILGPPSHSLELLNIPPMNVYVWEAAGTSA